MITTQILIVIVILAVAYRKEIIALFKKTREGVEARTSEGSTRKKKRPSRLKEFFDSIEFLSEGTKKFLRVLFGAALCVAFLIVIFLVCHILFPGGAGYALGGVIDFVLVIFGVLYIGEIAD